MYDFKSYTTYDWHIDSSKIHPWGLYEQPAKNVHDNGHIFLKYFLISTRQNSSGIGDFLKIFQTVFSSIYLAP